MKKKKKAGLGRRHKALLTRRRMLRAAAELFRERGYAQTTMEAIAERADVAVQSLYFTFHTKATLLEESVGAAIIGFDDWDPRFEAALAANPRRAFAESHPWFAEFEATKSASGALRVFVHASVGVLERVAPIVLAQAEAGISDPGVRAARELAEQRRIDDYALVIDRLAGRRKLRQGTTKRRARDVILTILSAETYRQLVERLGWSNLEYERWCCEVLESQLFERPPRHGWTA